MHLYSTSFLIIAFQCQASAQNQMISIVEDPTCPCLGDMVHLNTPKSRNNTCLDVQIAFKSNSTKYCYPPSYGSNCASHDKGLEPFCNDPNIQRDFCDSPFCYIDPSKCKLSENNSYSQSHFFSNLYYSYTTCGSNDRWREFPITEQLKGETLRVGVPALYYPDHFKFDADGNPIFWNPDISAGVGDFQGIYIDLLTKLSLFGGFNVHYESVSAHALKEHQSTWDACIQDVAHGILDMCVGNYWETTERREKVQFSTAIFNENFYMRTPLPQEDKTFKSKMQIIFKPFTGTLWLTIILATIGVGISYTILDSKRKTSMSGITGKIAESIYSATMELMNGANQNEDTPAYIKSVTVTWSFFVLIIIASYTANLAAFLAQTKVNHKYTSVTDCIGNHCNLCHGLSATIRNSLQNKFPSLRRFHQFPVREEVPIALSNGTCDIYLESKHSWEFKEELWGDCKTMWLGDFVLSFKVGWPVSLPLLAPMNYWVGRGLEVGALDVAFRKFSPIPGCVEPVENNQVGPSVNPIGVESMTAPLLLLGSGICFGMIYKFLKSSTNHMTGEEEIKNQSP